jgi:hypothetical protein
LAPVWATLFWPVLGLSCAAIVLHSLRLAGKAAQRTADIVALVVHVAGLIVGGVALNAGDWVVISAAGLPPEALAGVHRGVNIGVGTALIVLVVIAACQAAYDVWRLGVMRRPS